jgi:hypothetical protein
LFYIFITICNSQIQGYWWTTWKEDELAPSGTNLAIAYSERVYPEKALAQSSIIKDALPGDKFISLGGDNNECYWSQNVLSIINDAIKDGRFDEYRGIAYDIGVGDVGLAEAFENSFKEAKANRKQVLVTIRHPTPYGIEDASELMDSFLNSNNIDLICPQLYTEGKELENDYSDYGVSWKTWRNSKAPIIVSIFTASLYEDARDYFKQKDIDLKGYIQWSNAAPSEGTVGSGHARCGTSWADANSKCENSCTVKSDCVHLGASGDCYKNLQTCATAAFAAETSTSESKTNNPVMSATEIGLIVALVIVGIALIVVLVFLVKAYPPIPSVKKF